MKTITVEYELYDVHELEEQFPDGFRKAREQMVADLWEVWGTEAVSDTMRMVADNAGCPFTTRFLEWDLYRGEIGYVGGSLDHKEWTALLEWEPELAGHEDLALIVRYGLIQQSEDYARDDEAEPLIDGINERLRDLYGEMMGAGRQEELYMESEEYFREHCEANEYTFEANGRMRNA